MDGECRQGAEAGDAGQPVVGGPYHAHGGACGANRIKVDNWGGGVSQEEGGQVGGVGRGCGHGRHCRSWKGGEEDVGAGIQGQDPVLHSQGGDGGVWGANIGFVNIFICYVSAINFRDVTFIFPESVFLCLS